MLPIAYAELAALEELEKPHICKSCRTKWLLDNMEVICEDCGKTFEDPERRQQLSHK